MTGERESDKTCAICGGPLHFGEATIPYVLDNDTVIVVKNVPAEICSNCHETFTSGQVTDQITLILSQLKELHSEVSVVSYPQREPA